MGRLGEVSPGSGAGRQRVPSLAQAHMSAARGPRVLLVKSQRRERRREPDVPSGPAGRVDSAGPRALRPPSLDDRAAKVRLSRSGGPGP